MRESRAARQCAKAATGALDRVSACVGHSARLERASIRLAKRIRVTGGTRFPDPQVENPMLYSATSQVLEEGVARREGFEPPTLRFEA